MKVRATVNERAELLLRDGSVIGSLASVTLDLDLSRLGVLARAVEPVPEAEAEQPVGEQQTMLPDPLAELWGHYQKVVPGGERRKLDNRRRRIMQKALKVRPLNACKDAVTELSKSRFHLGENDRKTKYLDIEYALGKPTQSPDEVIDRWLERRSEATTPQGEANDVQRRLADVPQTEKAAVAENIRRVRAKFARPEHEPTVKLGSEAEEALRKYPAIEVVTDVQGRFQRWRCL